MLFWLSFNCPLIAERLVIWRQDHTRIGPYSAKRVHVFCCCLLFLPSGHKHWAILDNDIPKHAWNKANTLPVYCSGYDAIDLCISSSLSYILNRCVVVKYFRRVFQHSTCNWCHYESKLGFIATNVHDNTWIYLTLQTASLRKLKLVIDNRLGKSKNSYIYKATDRGPCISGCYLQMLFQMYARQIPRLRSPNNIFFIFHTCLYYKYKDFRLNISLHITLYGYQLKIYRYQARVLKEWKHLCWSVNLNDDSETHSFFFTIWIETIWSKWFDGDCSHKRYIKQIYMRSFANWICLVRL